jgi:cytochrome c peroxidase
MNKMFKLPAILQFIVILFLVVFSSCENKTENAFEFAVPSNFPSARFPKNTPLNKEIIDLGKMLFYDPALSGNDSMSCASCHNIDYAFSDNGNALSKGIHGTPGFRNSPALFNLIWEKSLFRDGGVGDLETQVITPVTAHFEMDQNFKSLLIKLNKNTNYKTAFEKAFGSDTITGQKILSAIAQFERTIISTDSRYDRWIRKEQGAHLNDFELEGLQLFQNKCSGCHQGILFKDDLFHNNGLDSIFPGFEKFDEPKLGRARITYKPEDRGKYKTPTLRNIELTAPYMHDGRIKNLEDVLDHYQSGIKLSSTLDTSLFEGNKTGIPLTENEKKVIISFLKTLTDTVFIKNPDYMNPLKK